LPLLDLKRDVVDGRVASIPLGEILHADHRFFFLKVRFFVLVLPKLAETLFVVFDYETIS